MLKVTKNFIRIPTKTFFYAFLLLGLISVLALRHNNQTMIKLRSQVYDADRKNVDVNPSLNQLRAYVFGHMNTNLSSGNNNIKPPIQLKYTYQRLYDAQANKVQAANQKLYTDAELYCQSINSAYYGTTRVPCVQNYVINRGLKTANVSIPAGLYEFDFASPRWSPDIAGWSLVLSILSLLGLITRLAYSKIHK